MIALRKNFGPAIRSNTILLCCIACPANGINTSVGAIFLASPGCSYLLKTLFEKVVIF